MTLADGDGHSCLHNFRAVKGNNVKLSIICHYSYTKRTFSPIFTCKGILVPGFGCLEM